MNFDVMVTLVTIGARTSNFVYYYNLIIYVLVDFWGFLNKQLIFYEFFAKDLPIYAYVCAYGGERVQSLKTKSEHHTQYMMFCFSEQKWQADNGLLLLHIVKCLASQEIC